MSRSPQSSGKQPPKSAPERSPDHPRASLDTATPSPLDDSSPTLTGPFDHPPTPQSPAKPPYSGRFSPGDLIAGRFTVLRYIARGGMGEVYEVEDRMLQGVHVALKIILPEIADSAASARRFEQEVLLARKVTHPNLCPIYDIARSGTSRRPFLFLTMKLIDGETLSARLRRDPRLSRAETIAITRQLSAGIAAIHAGDVVHRDIKPNNVMLDTSAQELCLFLMDFGLARLHQPQPTEGASTVIAGTPGYMAPELLRGHSPTPATDLYALGVLLCEVFSRTERVAAASPSKVPTRTPSPADLPAPLVDAVKDLLAEDPELRPAGFQRLQAAVQDETHPSPPRPKASRFLQPKAWLVLKIAATTTVLLLAALSLIPAIRERARGILMSSHEKHIAILPLDSTSGTAETQAIGDGLMDSLAGKLSNLNTSNSSLWVIPTSELRSRKVTTPEAAMKEFGATIVVEGSFRRDADGSHLHLTLIDPRKIRQIGSIPLDSRDGDLTGLEDEAVQKMVRLMNIPLLSAPKTAGPGTTQAAAYEDYLAGLGFFDRQDKPENLDKAISSLEAAVRKDPYFSLAYALLTRVDVLKYNMKPDDRWIQAADASSRKAAETGPQLSDTYVALAQYHNLTGKRELAIQEFQRALSLDPRNADALQGIADAYGSDGKMVEAEAAYQQAIDLRPLDWQTYNALGNFYVATGRPLQAIGQFQHAIQLTPDNSWPYSNLGHAYQEADDPKLFNLAEQSFQHAIALDPNFVTYSNLGVLYAVERRFPEAIAAHRSALQFNDQTAGVWSNLAAAYAWTGSNQEASVARSRAIQLYERAVKLNPQDSTSWASLAPLYAQNGNRDAALRAVHISLAQAPKDPYVLSQVAEAFELLNDRSEALKYLQDAMADGISLSDLRGDFAARNLISDPRLKIPASVPRS